MPRVLGGLLRNQWIGTGAHHLDPSFCWSFVYYSDDDGRAWKRSRQGEIYIWAAKTMSWSMTAEPSVAEVEPRVRRFLESMPVNFPVLLDQDRAVAKAWKISTLPSTVVLDSGLKPKLVVEADYAWDRIEPDALIEMLRSAQTTPTTKSTNQGGKS